MSTIDAFGSELMLLNGANILMGLVVVGLIALVLGGSLFDIWARRRKRAI